MLVSLSFVLLASSLSCVDDVSCSLNGVCATSCNLCECDVGWKGELCEYMTWLRHQLEVISQHPAVHGVGQSSTSTTLGTCTQARCLGGAALPLGNRTVRLSMPLPLRLLARGSVKASRCTHGHIAQAPPSLLMVSLFCQGFGAARSNTLRVFPAVARRECAPVSPMDSAAGTVHHRAGLYCTRGNQRPATPPSHPRRSRTRRQ